MPRPTRVAASAHFRHVDFTDAMRPITDAEIASSFINASRSERKNITLPADFDDLAWDRLDFLGWRDPKLQNVAYVVVDAGG